MILRSGAELRVTGPADAQLAVVGVNGGQAGDLYVVLKVKEHPIFERQDNDLHCSVPINIAQAGLGSNIDILTFDGLQTIQIPEGTQNAELKNEALRRARELLRGTKYEEE